MENRSSPKRCQFWAYYRVYSHSVIQTIQNELRPLLPNNYEEVEQGEYHVTIHPQFQFPMKKEKTYENIIRKHFPKQIEITSTSFHFHPSRSEPRVLCLSVETNIPFKNLQEKLNKEIRSDDHGKVIINPVPPHITLFTIDDPSTEMMKLPPNIDEIFDRCNELAQTELPVTFKENELKFEPTQDYQFEEPH